MHICTGRGVDIPDVVALAEQFQVSQEAMLYRLLNAGLISEAQVNKVKNLIPQHISSQKHLGKPFQKY